jgi:hypothetical protein
VQTQFFGPFHWTHIVSQAAVRDDDDLDEFCQL